MVAPSARFAAFASRVGTKTDKRGRRFYEKLPDYLVPPEKDVKKGLGAMDTSKAVGRLQRAADRDAQLAAPHHATGAARRNERHI